MKKTDFLVEPQTSAAARSGYDWDAHEQKK